MESIGNIFKQREILEKTSAAVIKSQRDEVLRKFEGKVSIRDRKTKALRQASLAEIAIILRHCPTQDLYPFLRECEKAKTFGAYFWWAVKGRAKREQKAQTP